MTSNALYNRKRLSLTFGERVVTAIVLVFVLNMSFPQYTHASVEVPVKKETDFSTAFEFTKMVARGESIDAPIVVRQFASSVTETTASKKARKTTWVLVTAYSSTPDQTDGSPYLAARGTFVRDGMVAANFLPFGTRVRFPDHFGEKEFFVEDRMNARYDRRIDIWMPTREEAKQWGARWVKVEIL